MDERKDDIVALLKEIRDLLRDQQQARQLGFGDPPAPQHVFCNRSHGCNWYTLGPDGSPKPIEAAALTGYLIDVSFETTVRLNKQTSKLHLTVQADREYRLEAGATTQFTRSLLASMARYGPGELRGRLITLQPMPGNNTTSVFCRLYVDGQLAPRGDYPPTEDSLAWREVARKALAAVR